MIKINNTSYEQNNCNNLTRQNYGNNNRRHILKIDHHHCLLSITRVKYKKTNAQQQPALQTDRLTTGSLLNTNPSGFDSLSRNSHNIVACLSFRFVIFVFSFT